MARDAPHGGLSMRANLSVAVELILDHEGGYVNHPRDPGGCTNYGITIGTYRRLIDPNGTCYDLRAMGKGIARSIYQRSYWNAVKADSLPPGIDLIVFDHGVNAGPRRAARLLQAALGVSQDGIVGPLTLAAAWEQAGSMFDAQALVRELTERRLDYYRSLRGWRDFGRGWARRVHETERAAFELIEYAVESSIYDDDDRDEPGEPIIAPEAEAAPAPSRAAPLDPPEPEAYRTIASVVIGGLHRPNVAAWQAERDLVPDGIVGPQTWANITADIAGIYHDAREEAARGA
jgi:lysozyme family protein